VKQKGACFRASARLLWAILLLSAVAFEQVPAIGGKCIVRAALVQQAESSCTVGLLCQQPTASADAAEAEERTALYWGGGKTLADAYADAQAKLPGEAVYSLCDAVVACGGAPRETLLALQSYIADSGNGRLAARTACCAENAAAVRRAVQQDDSLCAQIYQTLQSRMGSMPRLYGAAGTLLLPVIPLESGNADGACLLLAGRQSLRLNGQTAEAAALLLYGRGTFTARQGTRPYTARCFLSAQLSGNRVLYRVVGTVRGLPAEKKARRAALQSLCTQLGAALRAVPQAEEWNGSASLLALRDGKPNPPAGLDYRITLSGW
jgi:hypothetical protein